MAQNSTSVSPSTERSTHHSTTLPEVYTEPGLLVVPPDSTLEACYSRTPALSNEKISSTNEPLKHSEYILPWWRTHWIWIIAGAIIIAGGIIGGAVEGTMGNRFRYETPTEVLSSSSFISSVTSTAITSASASASSTRTTRTGTVRTQTPAPSATPSNQVYVGKLDDDTPIGFVVNGSSNAACAWAVNHVPDGHNPCGSVFTLPDGFEYVWNGCGGDVWITCWNPSNHDEVRFQDLGSPRSCGYVPMTYKCGTVTILAEYICPNHTIGG
ncbi:hypothetical protein PG996_002207 [Apiospora saccharicola]|uniref:Uncharacterized protein n=1 Tax=Apiospora saccharicola TaxID=335842 RepID=A0ABR1WIT4_9PEZI